LSKLVQVQVFYHLGKKASLLLVKATCASWHNKIKKTPLICYDLPK
jgi:hypothetical protein